MRAFTTAYAGLLVLLSYRQQVQDRPWGKGWGKVRSEGGQIGRRLLALRALLLGP